MKNIKDYNLDSLKEEFVNMGEKSFRAGQVFKWLYVDKVKEFDEMTNLSLDLREKLKQNYTICNFKILKKQESVDGTKKYLFHNFSTCKVSYKFYSSRCTKFAAHFATNL